MENPTEITERQLKVGYWYLTHKEALKKWLKIALIIVNVVLWGYGAYGLIRYYFLDAAVYNQMLSNLAKDLVSYQTYRSTHRPLSPQIVSAKVIALGEERYDIIARLQNPNPDWLIEFDYQFVSEAVSTSVKRGFILPGEEKFLTALGVKTERVVRSPRIDLSNFTWRRIEDYALVRGERLNFELQDVKFISAQELSLSGRVPVSRTTFTIVNKTVYNFWGVGVYVALYQGSALTALNYITLEELLSNEARPVEISWYERLANVNKVSVEPEVNILDPKSFMGMEGGTGEVK